MSEITPPASPFLAKLNYPKNIQKLIADFDSAYSVFAEKETEYEIAKEALNEAREADARLLVEAVTNGAADPGTPNEDKLKREVIYNLEAAKQARAKAQKAASALSEEIRQTVPEIAALAVEKARKGVQQWQETISRLQAEYAEAVQARRTSTDGLEMISYLPSAGVSFNANYPIQRDARFPETHENSILGICNLIEKVILKDSDDTKSEEAA